MRRDEAYRLLAHIEAASRRADREGVRLAQAADSERARLGRVADAVGLREPVRYLQAVRQHGLMAQLSGALRARRNPDV